MKQYIDGRCDICGAPDAEGCWNKENEEPTEVCEECRAMEANIVQ